MKIGGIVVSLTILLGAMAGCSSDPPQAPAAPPGPPAADDKTTTVAGALETLSRERAPDWVTYRPDLVPPGTSITVVTRSSGDRSSVLVTAKGLKPNQLYTAHAHARPCGTDPNASGPHYQNVVDPVQPSVDPAFANPANELWLDLMSDVDGRADADSTVTWHFREGEARSLVLHAGHTRTAHGVAGTAGARIACATVEFG